MYRKAKLHFKKVDPILHAAARQFDIEDLESSENLFEDIVWTIIGQQLSGRAANTIFERLKKIISETSASSLAFSPETLLSLPETEFRVCGISGNKMRTIKNICEEIISAKLNLDALKLLADHDVTARLTKIKGIGPWTAEMILMFSLGRADVFSVGDLGLKKGVKALYKLRKLPDEKKLTSIAKKWSPYRTYAARILYRVADKAKTTDTV